MGCYDMVQDENSLAYIRVSQDLWMVKIPHGSWWGEGGGRACLLESNKCFSLGPLEKREPTSDAVRHIFCFDSVLGSR